MGVNLLKTQYMISGKVPDTFTPDTFTPDSNGVYVESRRFDAYPSEEEIAEFMSEVGMVEAKVSRVFILAPSEAYVLTVEDGEPQVEKRAPQASEERDVQKMVEVKIYAYQARMRADPAAIFLNMSDRERLAEQKHGRAAERVMWYKGIPVITVPAITEPMVGG